MVLHSFHQRLSTIFWVKGATKSYLTHCSCVVIVFLNMALCRSAFSAVSFRKLVFRFSVPSWSQDIKICAIMLCNFVHTLYKNSPFIHNKLFIKILQYYVKTCFQKCFEFLKKLIYKEERETIKNKKREKHYHKKSQLRNFFKYA